MTEQSTDDTEREYEMYCEAKRDIGERPLSRDEWREVRSLSTDIDRTGGSE